MAKPGKAGAFGSIAFMRPVNVHKRALALYPE